MTVSPSNKIAVVIVLISELYREYFRLLVYLFPERGYMMNMARSEILIYGELVGPKIEKLVFNQNN